MTNTIILNGLQLKELKNAMKKAKNNELKIETKNDVTVFTLHDPKNSVLTEILFEDVGEIEETLIEAGAISDIKYIKNNDSMTIFKEDGKLRMSRNGLAVTYTCENADADMFSGYKEEFEHVLTFNADDIKNLKNARVSTGESEARPVLKNVVIRNGEMSSTDSFRLYTNKVVQENEYDNKDILINNNVIDRIVSIAKKDSIVEVSNGVYRQKIEITSKNDKVFLYCQLPEGNYPDASRLIPDDMPTKFEVDKKQIITTMKSVLPVAKRMRNHVIKMTFKGDQAIITTGEDNEVEVALPIYNSSMEDGFEISMSATYLTDGISQMNANNLVFSMNTSLRPFTIKDSERKTDETALVLPVRTK